MNKIRFSFLRNCLKHLAWAGMIFCFSLAYQSIASAEEQSSLQILKGRIQSVFPDKEVEINDYDNQLKEITVNSEHFFASHDGRYVFAGPIYDTHEKIDIVSERAAIIRKKLLSAQPDERFVRYPSTVREKYQITVVTDVDCPYCRKLHNTLGELNKQGVSVNYVMLPRAGVNSESYSITLDALCSKEPAMNITRAMAKEALAETSRECDSSRLTEHIKLAQMMKIRSTPTFVLPNGQLHIGFIRPDQVMSLLDGIDL